MDPKKLLQADYLDIIYDNRNKLYGGYELRKSYNRRIKKGVGFLMLGLSAIVSFSFINIEKEKTIVPPTVYTNPTIVDIEKKAIVPPPKPPSNPPPPAANTHIFTIPKITDEEIKPEQQMSKVEDLTKSNSGLSNVDSGAEGITPPIAGTGPASTGPVTPPATASIPIFVEQMPAPAYDMLAYLAKNISYPPNAREAGIQGRVGVQFVINEDGSISNVKVVRSIGGGCDEEAMRVIKSMPKWKPGKNNGTAVKVLFTQPIMFSLQ